MIVTPLPAFTDNYIWVFSNNVNRVLTCIDPGEAGPVIEYAINNKLLLKTILLTHHHLDHIGGVNDLIHAFPNVMVIAPEDSRISNVNMRVADNNLIKVDNYEFIILEIPGHTSSHIAYYEAKQEWLFCGDTLFSAGCGRVFDGSIEQLYNSLNILKKLPGTTKVFCAHEYTQKNLRFASMIEPENKEIIKHINQIDRNSVKCTLPSTIKIENEINPFLRTDSIPMQNFASKNGIQINDSLAIFKFIRKLKDSF